MKNDRILINVIVTKSLESHEKYVSLTYEFEICRLLRIHSLYEVSFLVKIILLSLHIYPATWNRVTLMQVRMLEPDNHPPVAI